MSRRRANIIFAALACQIVFAASARAEDACNLPSPQEEPAGGKWKGELQQEIEQRLQASGISVSTVSAWRGDIEFILGHDPADVERIEPLPPCIRVPAGHAPIEGCRSDGTRIDETKKFKIVKVPTDGTPHLSGNAHVAMSMTMTSSITGLQGQANAVSQAPEELNTEAVVSNDRLDAISLTGQPGQFSMALNYGFQGSGISTGGSMTVGGNGTMNGQYSEHDSGGSGTGTLQVGSGGQANSHSVYTSNDGKTDTHDVTVSDPTAARDSNKAEEILHLTIEVRECGFMKGKIDTSKIPSTMPGGSQVKIQKAEWSATLEERDVEFENAVRAFVDEPMPQTLTWDYVSAVTSRLDAFRAQKNSDYGRCVLARTQSKFIDLMLQALRTLNESYPKRCEGATDAVMAAANERLLGLLRPVQLLGIREDCPAIATAGTLLYGSPGANVSCQ